MKDLITSYNKLNSMEDIKLDTNFVIFFKLPKDIVQLIKNKKSLI